MKSNSRFNTVFFFTFLGAILLLTYRVVAPYLVLIIVTFLIATLLRPIYICLYKWLGKRSSIATFLTIIVFLLIGVLILIPIGIMTYNQARIFTDDVAEIVSNNIGEIENIDKYIDDLNARIEPLSGNEETITVAGIQEKAEEILSSVGQFVLNGLGNVVESGATFISNTIIFFVMLATFLSIQPKLIQYLKRLSPLDDKIDDKFIKKFIAMSTSMITGTFVIAIVQGVIGGIVLQMVGVPYAFFWGLLGVLLSIIPLGSGIIQIPIGVIQILIGNVVAGVVILFVHFVITTNIDNILRPKLVSEDAKVPEVLVLLGAFGGIQFFGPLGVIFGPAVMVLFTTVLDTYLEHYKD